jgi:pimeloyl-ACP methyl ester carboxylesterase
MPYANVNQQKLYFEDSGGSGPVVLCSHGFLMDHTMFDPQVTALAPAYRLVRWDERGFGRTEWDGLPFTYWDSAADAIGLLDHLGVERAALMGMSQGGYLSLRAALAAPSRVRALVLIDTQAGTDDPGAIAGYRQMFETWMEHGPIDPLVEGVASTILGGREHWEPWVSRWRAIPRERLRAPSECLLGRDDLSGRVREIACPALVVHGAEDVAIPFSAAEALARALPGSRGLLRVEGAAHAANLTHPDRVNPPVRAFLDGLG